ncbi:G5 domain-containing protein, partial [Streptococcus sp. GMD6S]
GQRPKVSVEESNQVASTVVDSGEDSLPVLVRLVSESGKQVKEYRIQLTKEKPVSEKTVAAVQEDLPKLEFVEKDLAYKTVEKKDSTLYLGETRVEQEGKVGKERIFTAVNPSGSKEEKLREVVEAPTDRIVLVGTKPGTSLPEDEVKNLVLNRPELVIEEETIDFKVQEQKNDQLPAGQTRILQEGRQGIRVHLIEVENGKRTEKESYDKVMAQNRIVEVGTAGETTKPVPQEATKPQVSEKADTKEIASSKANQAQKEQLPNTGSAASQAAVAAGLALLGLGAGLVATKGKKED